MGTEKLEQALIDRFPGVRVARLDRDTAAGKGMRGILARVGRREVDILVGTQMVTKGHDFPHVTLVGVICADLGLHFPDFRAAERTFQLLTQVAGRAGRGDLRGRVVIQTYSPSHPSVARSGTHDYEGFYASEIEARREAGYPPAAHLAALHVDGPDPERVSRAALSVAACARKAIERKPGVFLLGPAEAPIQKLKGRVRWMLLVKAESRPLIRAVLDRLVLDDLARLDLRGVRVTADVDPTSML
jgi:primosomal protein N' (replication factor Y)